MGIGYEKTVFHVVVSELHGFRGLYRANALYYERKLLITWEIR